MDFELITYLALAITITSLSWFAYAIKLKSNYTNLKTHYENLHFNIDREVTSKGDQKVNQLHNVINDLKTQIAEVRHSSYQLGYATARKEFSVKMYAHKETYLQGSKGLLFNDIFHRVEIGYKYQLFVNGIPVLQPAVVIVEILEEEKKEVDIGKIQDAIKGLQDIIKPIIENSKGLIQFLPKR